MDGVGYTCSWFLRYPRSLESKSRNPKKWILCQIPPEPASNPAHSISSPQPGICSKYPPWFASIHWLKIPRKKMMAWFWLSSHWRTSKLDVCFSLRWVRFGDKHCKVGEGKDPHRWRPLCWYKYIYMYKWYDVYIRCSWSGKKYKRRLLQVFLYVCRVWMNPMNVDGCHQSLETVMENSKNPIPVILEIYHETNHCSKDEMHAPQFHNLFSSAQPRFTLSISKDRIPR